MTKPSKVTVNLEITKFKHTAWDRKTNRYSCKECDFVGNNMFTHEAHMEKAHSQNFDCGLFDNELENLGDLEIHLITCEIYRCRHCINISFFISSTESISSSDWISSLSSRPAGCYLEGESQVVDMIALAVG